MRIANTPWGKPDSVNQLTPEIAFVSTPSHGGYVVKREALKKIPEIYKKLSFGGLGWDGFFEEDCDWIFVCMTFPELFPSEALKDAESVFNRYHNLFFKESK